MQNVHLMETSNFRHVGPGLAAAILIAAISTTLAPFAASTPGSDLSPRAGADKVIDLIQGQETVLWSALTGNVINIETVGWPSTDGTHELGGAVMMERPENGSVGIVDSGEKPMTMTFEVDS